MSRIRISPSGIVLSADAEAQRLLLRHGRELVGKDTREVTHPEDVWANRAAMRESLETRRPVALIKRYSRPDGTFVLARMFGAFTFEAGRPVFGEAVVTPVSLASLAPIDASDTLDPMPRPRLSRVRVRPAKPRKGDSRWRLRFTGPDQDTYRQTQIAYAEKTRPEVERLARQEELAANGGHETLGTVLAAYAEHSATVHAKGTTQAVLRASRWAETLGVDHVPAEDLDAALLLRAQDGLFAKLKGGTVKSYWSIWKRAWLWARARGLVSADWPDVGIRSLHARDRTQKRALTAHEVRDLVQFSATYGGGRYLTLVLALAETGARIGELLSADAEHLDATLGLLRLMHTKTGAPRAVPISPDLAAALSTRKTGPLFLGPKGTRLAHSTAHNLMLAWRRSRGLEGQVDLHSLRRYAIATMERSGVPRAAGRMISGHASSVIYDNYAAKGAYDARQAVQPLWLGTHACDVSQTIDKLPKQTRRPPGLSGDSRSLIQTLVPALRQALADGIVPACPSLRGILGVGPCRLSLARSALRQAIEELDP